MPLDVQKLREKAARETATEPSVRPAVEPVTCRNFGARLHSRYGAG